MSQTVLRWLGFAVLLSPLLLAYPLYYWAFNLAGTWYVSTDLEPEHRAVHLLAMYWLDMAMVVCLACFLGLVLLFKSGYKRKVTGWLLIPAGILLVPGILLLWITIGSYIKFSE